MKKTQKKSLGMVFGTFDLFHKWHEFYIREAKKYAKSLIVIIARDARVLSGKWFLPNNNELARRQNVENFLLKNFVKIASKWICLEKMMRKNFSKKKISEKKFQKILKKYKNFQEKSTELDDVAILGDKKNIFSPIEIYQPEILLFGYDQKVPEEKIFEKFPNIETKRMSGFQTNIYKSSILREKMKK